MREDEAVATRNERAMEHAADAAGLEGFLHVQTSGVCSGGG